MGGAVAVGWVVPTPAGTFRAGWRDPSGKERSKTFKTKKAAKTHLADVEAAMARGAYVDDRAGKVRFVAYAASWFEGRNDELATRARDASVMRNHVVPQWESWQLAKIGHTDVQAWVTGLSRKLSPASVAECHRLFKAIMTAAVRDRVIMYNPAEGVKVPRRRKTGVEDRVISRADLVDRLLPVVPDRYRALVALAAGSGLRWGECNGLGWPVVDLDAAVVRVGRVAVEVSGRISYKPYPKSQAGRRSVPLPPFAVEALRWHRERYAVGREGVLFTSKTGEPLRRGTFRAKVWRPSLVRAGLLGGLVQVADDCWRAEWTDATGAALSKEFRAKGEAVAHVARW